MKNLTELSPKQIEHHPNVCLSNNDSDDFDEYLVFGGIDTQQYFEQYEQSEQRSHSPTEEEYSEYLASLENDQVRG